MYVRFYIFLTSDSRKDKTEKHLNSSAIFTSTKVSKYTGTPSRGIFLD